MEKYSKQMLNNHLKALGIRYGDNLVVHSRLLSFGIINHSNPASMITEEILNLVGEEGTLVYPTYLLTKKNFIYDSKKTQSIGSGILGNYLIGKQNTVRSLCPIHNHIGIGNKNYILRMSKPNFSMGKGSDFEILENYNFKLILLGCSMSEGCTYAHYVESIVGVPYRKWTKVKKKVRNSSDDKYFDIDVNYYARSDHTYTEDFSLLENKVIETQKCIVVPLPFGKSISIELKCIKKILIKEIKQDQYFLVKKIHKVKRD